MHAPPFAFFFFVFFVSKMHPLAPKVHVAEDGTEARCTPTISFLWCICKEDVQPGVYRIPFPPARAEAKPFGGTQCTWSHPGMHRRCKERCKEDAKGTFANQKFDEMQRTLRRCGVRRTVQAKRISLRPSVLLFRDAPLTTCFAPPRFTPILR